MSDYRILQDISLHIRGLLFDGLAGDDEVGGSFTSENNISLASPADLADGNSDVLVSLYLYQVLPNAHMNNQNLIPIGNDQQQYPPVSLDLSYLLTPMGASPEEDLVILGHSVQILAANSIVRANFLDSDFRTSRPEIRITANPVNLEELTRIWSAFNEPYRLSVCYQVQAVAVDSSRTPLEERAVLESLIDVHQTTSDLGAR
ncbi:MAG: DUF4255 domain-containing protein [Chloroflexi bacterium]|nr:DUF4255 domain-containing protein [Chloroflexota bacterium]